VSVGPLNSTSTEGHPPLQFARAIAEMPRFAALHKVQAAVEVLPMDHVNPGQENLCRNEERYRILLAA